MKIFISWSGERSKRVAFLLRSWLKCVLQASTPWMSDVDIDRGAAWFSEINKALEDCINGIICITKGNLNKPWLMFEAGALAKGLSSSRVYTFLVDLGPNDVSDPLSQFNHTLPTDDGMMKLVKTLNSRMGGYALPAEILDNVFITYWPQFENEFKDIIANTTEEKLPERNDTDIINDVLLTMRRMEKRLAIIENRAELKANSIVDFKRKMDSSSKLLNESLDDILMEAYLLGTSDDDAIRIFISKCGLPPKEAREIYINYVLKMQEKEFIPVGISPVSL